MNADLGALATRLYVTIDDLLKDHPDWQPERPAVGIAPQLTDAELVTLAAVQALLGYTSERRFIRYAHTHLRPWFSFLPQRAACNKRLRAACNMMQHVIGAIARDCPSYTDDLWVVDSTPRRMRPLPRNRQTIGHGRLRQLRVLRQPLPLFWGLRLHLIATPSGLPVGYALTSATTDERDSALAMIHLDPNLSKRANQVLMADKGYRSASFEAELNDIGITLIRPSPKSEKTSRPTNNF